MLKYIITTTSLYNVLYIKHEARSWKQRISNLQAIQIYVQGMTNRKVFMKRMGPTPNEVWHIDAASQNVDLKTGFKEK